MLRFINEFMNESINFAMPWAISTVAIVTIWIIVVLTRGKKVKNILTGNNLKIAFNDYWKESDNNGALLKSPKGPSMRLIPLNKIPVDLNKTRKGVEKMLGYQKIKVLDFKHIQKTVNGFLWDILLYKTSPCAVLFTGFLAFQTNGIAIESNLTLQDDDDFEKENIDFDNMLSFLRKET